MVPGKSLYPVSLSSIVSSKVWPFTENRKGEMFKMAAALNLSLVVCD